MAGECCASTSFDSSPDGFSPRIGWSGRRKLDTDTSWRDVPLMHVETLILADNAVAAEGKLYLHGAGISRITPPQLPWPHPMLSFVIRLEADDMEDFLASHELTLSIDDPDGNVLLPPNTLTMSHSEPPQLLDGEPLYANLVFTVAPILFRKEGLHSVKIELDAKPAAAVPLPVGLHPSAL